MTTSRPITGRRRPAAGSGSISTRLLFQVADYIEAADNLRTKDDVVRYLRDVALVLDLKEFTSEINLDGPTTS